MQIKATKLSAFLVGVGVIIFFGSTVLLESDSLIVRIVGGIILVTYWVTASLYVFGEQQWYRYRWIPADGMIAASIRMLHWFAGGIIGTILSHIVFDMK